MGFEKVYITKKGSLLAAKTLQGKKIEFDHAEIGSGTLNGNPRDKTALTTKVIECQINDIKITGETQAQISFSFKNTDTDNAFYFREIGLFAVDPDTQEKVLYAYTNAGETAEYINNSITELIEKNIDITVLIDNASNINITLDPTHIYINEKELEATVEEIQVDYNNKFNNLKSIVVAQNGAAHNAIFRGKNITDLFYDGTLSRQIAAGTFDDIFIGDYIIGKTSGRKYLVADINYRLHMGDTECKTPHVLMIPERTMGTAQMNSTNITTGAYVGSEMYTTNLTPFKTVIKNDFGAAHVLKHRNHLQNAVTNGYASGGTWYDSEIELMNEPMVYGSHIFAPHTTIGTSNTTIPNLYTIDKQQLSLFRLKHEATVALNDEGGRMWYWLRDVVSSAYFAHVLGYGHATSNNASNSSGVRPAFLIY